MLRKVLTGLLLALIAIQFFRPAKNIHTGELSENDISKTFEMPQEIHRLLVTKCYDCHSNHTNYRWYYNIQPVAWWMAHHIEEGKEHLNFSEFKTYAPKKAAHKIEEISETIAEGSMPLSSYVIMHPNTEITTDEAATINNWIQSLGLPEEEHHH